MTGIVRYTVNAKPVGVNASYARGRGRRLYKTDAAEAFMSKLQYAARRAMRGEKPMEGELWASIRFVFDSERPDIDGPIKPVLDSMQKIVFGDDRQVRKLTVERTVDRAFPRVEVEVWKWNETPRSTIDEDAAALQVRPSKREGEPA